MKILIATDGSNASKSVIETASGVIRIPEQTSVKIISAVEPLAPITAVPFANSAEYYGEVETVLSQQSRDAIKRAEADLKRIFPQIRDISTEVLQGGAAQVITETAKDWGADLIIVGSHGYGFWSRALLGSVSNSVVHHAPCSVLVVRPKIEKEF
jgi:nucleotide-binding universal stress UspA family protein